MPIFRLEGEKLIIAEETDLELECHLETWLENSPRSLTGESLLWIGRQTSATDEEGTIFPDLLGVDSEGNLVIVELKRDRAPREVVAQLLEYAAWADELSGARLRGVAEDYFNKLESFKGKSFDDAFRERFEMLETEDIPMLNRTMRLFIIAEEIPARVARVCRFLRTSQSMDINCIDVSTFQTEAGERLVSMEVKVGDEDISTSKTQKQRISRSSSWSAGEPLGEVVWKTAQELMRGDKEYFTPKEVEGPIMDRYPDLRLGKVSDQVYADCVNYHKRSDYPGGSDRYWRIEFGKYRLYDPERDKMVNAGETD